MQRPKSPQRAKGGRWGLQRERDGLSGSSSFFLLFLPDRRAGGRWRDAEGPSGDYFLERKNLNLPHDEGAMRLRSSGGGVWRQL